MTTKDGYILSLHRIPRSPKNDPLLKTFQNSDNKVVLLIPGLFSSSADFVLMGPNKSLGKMINAIYFEKYLNRFFYVLALFLSDHGYDVWLGNNRGNKYSRMHQNLDPDSNLEYWDFRYKLVNIETTIEYINKLINDINFKLVGMKWEQKICRQLSILF